MKKFLAELAIQTKIIIIVIIVIFTPLIVDAPVEEDFDRSLTECLFPKYQPKPLPELYFLYEIFPHEFE